jgi:EAL domain-containing protein (putative c-di-GMP-specific phosphodiesterase class I)
LAPVKFLPVIEDHPLAVDIGEWVIDRALSQMQLWQAGGLDIAVGVSEFLCVRRGYLPVEGDKRISS